MALETATYPYDLVSTNPTASDPKSQGDDHLRLVKTVLKNAIPGFVGVVIGTSTESGSANAYAITLDPAPAAYSALVGALLMFKATHANTGAATLNVNSLGTKPIVDVNGGALASGDIANGSAVAAVYDGTSFCLVSPNDRAPIDSPTFTGTPAAPTPSAADNSTKVATTAYVDAADALKANLASPALTGTPTAPTAAVGTNTDQLATMAALAQQVFTASLPAQASNATKFLQTDGASASWQNVPIAPDVVMRASTGVTLSGWTDLTINTTDRNQGSIASLAANKITLAAGTYYARAAAPMKATSSPGNVKAAGSPQLRLYNNTDAAQIGSAGDSANLGWDQSEAFGTGATPSVILVFTLAGTKDVKLQAQDASGNSITIASTSCLIEIWKVA